MGGLFRLRDKHELKAWKYNDTECSGKDQKVGVTGIAGVERSAWSPSCRPGSWADLGFILCTVGSQ